MQIRVDNFLGLNLRADEKKGAFCHALVAKNCDVRERSLDPVRSINVAGAVSATYTKSIYHLGATWLQWDSEVTVARSPTGDAADRRVVFTGDDVPKTTDLYLAAAGTTPPGRSLVLGIPVPGDIGYLYKSGAGTGLVETRAYVYTYVNAWGEEGPPSGAGSIDVEETDSTVLLNRLGVTSRHYTSNPYAQDGIPCNVTFVGLPVPGYLHIDLTGGIPDYQYDMRVGDRVFLSHNTAPGLANQSYLVSEVNAAGTWVRVQANCWPPNNNGAGAVNRLYRVAPLNQMNVLIVAKGVPAAGKCTVYLDNADGVRIGEKLTFSGATGLTDLNTTFTVEAFSKGADIPTFPGVVITLTSAQVHNVGTGIGVRTAPHNTAEVRVTNITFAAGVATIFVESNAYIAVGDGVLIRGVLGAYEINGVRTVVSVIGSDRFTVAIAALSAYTQGGSAALPVPYAFQVWDIANVHAAGGGAYPAPFTTVIDINGSHDFEVGEKLLGFDIGGAVECNTELVVSAVSGLGCTVSMASTHAAWTAGGHLARISVGPRKRIYRTVTGQSGAEYQLVAEMPADRCRYTDTKNAEQLGQVLTTDGYIQPPVGMHSIQLHPHGFLQGLSGNLLCQTPAGQPHAWPTSLQRKIGETGLALGLVDTTAVVLTAKRPIAFYGASPDSLTRQILYSGGAYSATGHRSFANTGTGVAYRSNVGIYAISGGSGANLTIDFLRETAFATKWNTAMAWWDDRLRWFDGDLTNGAAYSGYVLEPGTGDRAITQWEADYPFRAFHVSTEDGKLYASYIQDHFLFTLGAGQVLTTPANAALDAITGDINIEVFVTAVDWTPGISLILAHRISGAQQHFSFLLGNPGILSFTYWNGAANVGAGASAALTITDGAPYWVRVNRQASTGTIRYYQSTNGVDWTQVGIDVAFTAGNLTPGGTLYVGNSNTGGVPWNGKYFRARVYNGLDSSAPLAAEMAAQDYVSGGTFVSSATGETWTLGVVTGVFEGQIAPFADFASDTVMARFTYWTQYLRITKPVAMTVFQADFDWAVQTATLRARESNYAANKMDGGSRTIYSPSTAHITPETRYFHAKVIANPNSSADDPFRPLTVVFDDFVVDGQAIRMDGAGIAADMYHIQLVGNCKVSAATIAETIEELNQS